MKINFITIGCFLGLIVPVLVVLFYYSAKYSSEISIQQFANNLLILKIYTHVMALGVYVSNLALFFLFIKTDLLKAAKGVLLATILYTIAITIFRFGF